MTTNINFQAPPVGFDSYASGIIPNDQAVLAGAFSMAMQQIRNIQSVDIEDFAQVAYSIETMSGLPFVNGTDIPTDLSLAVSTKSQIALGSGVYGTFTNSDFFGCMTGLPYPLKAIYDGIKQLETETLKTIYQNLYLAVTWEQATATYDGTNFTYTNSGGGYCRDNNPVPSVTVGGNPAIAVIGTDPNDMTTFGRLISITYTGPAGPVVIGSPPGAGWPSLNTDIANYITSANNEIAAIQNLNANNSESANILNTNWNITGIALKHEQRARHNFLPAVPIPYDKQLNISPTSQVSFVDNIPSFAKKTLPHMAAQTLEHISNQKSTGGQSIIAMMRQERNQERLNKVGISLDNNISDVLSKQQQQMLLTNGTLPNAVEGVPSKTGVDYTLPAWPAVETVDSGNICDNNITTKITVPTPVAVFDTNSQTLREVITTTTGNISTILNNDCLGPFKNGTGPVPNGITELPPGLPPPKSQCGNVTIPELLITPCLDNNGQIPNVIVNPLVPVGETPELDPNDLIGLNLQQPVEIIPPNLDTAYTSTTLIPSTYDITTAIDKVVECNCDCWIQ